MFVPEALNQEALRGEGIPGMPETAASAQLIMLANIAIAILISPVVNALATFGEEFGWRGYLQPKLLPLGERIRFLVGQLCARAASGPL